MNIGLDYDHTYTLDPDAWNYFISFMRSRGHKVYIVTWRYEWEGIGDSALQTLTNGVFFTSRKGKEKFMDQKGIDIDVWIDDNPAAILGSMNTVVTISI